MSEISFVCKARRQQDEYHCHRCGLVWDAKEEKPECSKNNRAEQDRIDQARERIKHMIE